MSLALVAMSHSPLLEFADPPADIVAQVQDGFEQARRFARDFDPDVVVTFGPDHYNGFFYEIMPPFCVGFDAVGVGDYDTQEGPLDVPEEFAVALTEAVQADDVDIAVSRRMDLDHGAIQPLEILFGDIAARPVVPIFVNGVAKPFVPMRRVRAMGQAVGRFLAGRDERILLIASGGLSHDPPVPQWATADESARAMLLAGRNPTPEARAARQQRVIDTAKLFTRGEADILDLNPEWDRAFMDVCRSGDPTAFDAYEADDMARAAGNSAHEVRTWVAGFSALSAAGPYETTFEYYRPIKEYIAGFGVMTCLPR